MLPTSGLSTWGRDGGTFPLAGASPWERVKGDGRHPPLLLPAPRAQRQRVSRGAEPLGRHEKGHVLHLMRSPVALFSKPSCPAVPRCLSRLWCWRAPRGPKGPGLTALKDRILHRSPFPPASILPAWLG